MLIALHDFNKFLVHYNAAIYSYPLSGVSRVFSGDQSQESLEKCVEKVSGTSTEVQLARAGKIGNRTISKDMTLSNIRKVNHKNKSKTVIYSSRKLLQMNLQVLEAIHPSETLATPRHEISKSFRPFGEVIHTPTINASLSHYMSLMLALLCSKGSYRYRAFGEDNRNHHR
jgi:hypothetical protein